MKTLFVSIALLFCVVGCTTTPVAPTAKQQQIANAVEDVLSVGLVPVLAKNPAYKAEAKTVAALLVGFTGTELTTANIDSFLAKVNVAPDDAKIISGIVSAAWVTYQKRYAEQVGANVRPDVKLFLAAVARGINNAVSSSS